jgi:polysaccharide biosynthesis protein PslH
VSADKQEKKTLLICGDYPLPEITGGNIRTMNFVRCFEEYGSVDIVYSALLQGAESGNGTFANEYYLKKKDYPQDVTGRMRAVMGGQPYPVRAYGDSDRKVLTAAIESNKYDYILVRYIINAFSLFRVRGNSRKRIMLDFDDIFSGSLYGRLFYETKSVYKRIIRAANRRALLRYERKCLGLGVPIFCSEKDRMRTAPGIGDAFVVPNIYHNNAFEDYDFGNGFHNGKVLLFVGTLAYGPNVEGLKWFIETVYPEFKRQHPEGKLVVVGHLGDSSGAEVKRLCRSMEGVELYPNVADIKEYYKRCSVLVVPLLSGGGTRVKILEGAMASRPVLSTPVGAEGLELVNGKDLLLFQDSQEFSLRFKEVLEPKRYDSLVNSAKETVLENYSRERFYKAVKKILEKLDREE